MRIIDFDDGFESNTPATSEALPASDISNTPSGNLTSTNQQAVNNELQSDIDTRALNSDLTAHIADSSDAHDASSISVVGSGNLGADDVQEALEEHQNDIDTLNANKASTSALNAHTAATTSVHGIADTSQLATKSGVEVITNKDIDGGTASNARRITVPQNSLVNLQGLTRKKGTVFYDSSSDKLFYDNGTDLKQVGSGAGGGSVNLITDGSADDATASIFVPYADSGSRPTDGTGGSPSVTTSITSTGPIVGTKSYLLTKGASNYQGQGWSVPFTVDLGYRAKVLNITVDYIVNSGTFAAGSNSTDSDVIFYLYDVSNSKLIEPTSIKLLSNSSTVADKFSSTFQTSATGSSYRLIAHIASTSASAYELKVDNISISPSNYVYGTPITDWAPCTFTMSWVANASISGYSRRVGDVKEYHGLILTTGAPTPTPLLIGLPSGDVVDSTKLVTTTDKKIGYGTIDDSGTDEYETAVFFNSTTDVRVRVLKKSAGNDFIDYPSVTQASPMTWTNSDRFCFFFSVPIVGLSSSVQVSDRYDGRIIAARYTTSSQALGTATTDVVVLTTKDYDTTNSYNTSTGLWTCPRSGYYSVLGTATTTGRSSSTWDLTNYLFVDSIQKKSANTYSNAGSINHLFPIAVSDVFYLVAGQTVSLRVRAGYSGASLDGVADRNVFSIISCNDPSVISATETVAARYFTAAGMGLGTGTYTVIDYVSKSFDTHGAVTTGAGVWQFKCPAPGFYNVKSELTIVSGSGFNGTTETFGLEITKNGTTISRKYSYPTTTNRSHYEEISDLIECVAGDILSVKVYQDSGGSINLTPTSIENYIFINRIK